MSAGGLQTTEAPDNFLPPDNLQKTMATNIKLLFVF
jgi:hypothetical protein